MSEAFEVKIRFKQRDVLSQIIFNLALEKVICEKQKVLIGVII